MQNITLKSQQPIWWVSIKGMVFGWVDQVNNDQTYNIGFKVKGGQGLVVSNIKSTDVFPESKFAKARTRFIELVTKAHALHGDEWHRQE